MAYGIRRMPYPGRGSTRNEPASGGGGNDGGAGVAHHLGVDLGDLTAAQLRQIIDTHIDGLTAVAETIGTTVELLVERGLQERRERHQTAWLCPSQGCGHDLALHDIYDLADPTPRCCVEGCDCGSTP